MPTQQPSTWSPSPLERELIEKLGGSAEKVAEALYDPRTFARVILQSDLWPKQDEILQDIATKRKIAVKSCNSSGKSFLCAIAALWWFVRYPDGKVIVTAPGFTQVERVIWGEIHSAMNRSLIPLPQANRTDLRMKEAGDKGRTSSWARAYSREPMDAAQNWATGLSTNTGARFQGFHGGHMLIICDEATGIPEFIWEAIEGIRASGHVTLLIIGNPSVIGGYFFDAFVHPKRSRGWAHHTISAFDTPNFNGLTLDEMRKLPDDLDETAEVFQYKPRPYLANRFPAYEKLVGYGETSAVFQSLVLGEFPQEAEDALIPLRWLQAARDRKMVPCTAPIRVGIDVAGPGDNETVLQPVQGINILPLRAYHGLSDELVVSGLEPYRELLEVVNYDCIGMGTYFPKPMEKAGFPVVAVDVGKPAIDDLRFENKRAELYWSLRDRFRAGAVAGLVDELQFLQLASIKYKESKKGRTQIEAKEDARKRGVSSPDRADALMLAFGIAEPSMLKYYMDLARQQASGGTLEPPLPDIDKRPVLDVPPAPVPAHDDLYTRAAKRLTGNPILCEDCKQEIKGSRVEQGELKWHVECARRLGSI